VYRSTKIVVVASRLTLRDRGEHDRETGNGCLHDRK
jgi:hypothetical protein